MQPIEAFKPLGWISILGSWLALTLLVTKWRGHKGMSFSQHAAASRQAYVTMVVAETVVFTLFTVFIYKWFSPTFKLPPLFTVLVAMTSLGFVIAAWIPDTTGWKRGVHRVAAYGAAVLMVPAALIAFHTIQQPIIVRIFWALTVVYLLSCLLFFVFNRQKAYKYHLILQAPYIVLFEMTILMTTYIR